jgi:hypothetical protein
MERINAFFVWVEDRLERGAWFRRFYVIAATFLTWEVTRWCMVYATANAARPGLDVAAVIGAVSAVPGAVVAFAFQNYMASRGG